MSLPLPLPPPTTLPGIASPTSATLTTPRPQPLPLHPILLQDGLRVVPEISSIVGPHAEKDEEAGRGVLEDGGVDGDGSSHLVDGRMTPLADSNHSQSSASSGPSHDPPSPNPTTISTFSHTTQSTLPPPTFTANISHPAELGLGVQLGEEQLKTALQSKDRMFVLVLAKELEAFINRVASGQAISQSFVTGATTSALAALGPSTPIGVVPTSKFQRMLVYKAAEWYGLKAVPGPDGSMIAGVLGVFNEKSVGLRLSELVPAAPSPTQKFRIMQRAAPHANGSSNGSIDGEGASGDRQPKWKTLEEREAAYALAREKIYGKPDGVDGNVEIGLNGNADGSKLDGDKDRDRIIRGAAAVDDDDLDPVPRRRPPNPQFDNIVYPSLHHPPKAEPPPPLTPTVQDQYPIQHASAFRDNGVLYPSYAQTDINGYPIIGQMNAYIPQPPPQQQPYGIMQQPYIAPGTGYAGQQPQPDMYAQHRWQTNPPIPPTYSSQATPQTQPYMIPNQNVGPQASGQNWGYPPIPTNQPMPMIPQGLIYPSPYGYQPAPPLPQPQAQRQGSYPPLVQPTPTRPQPHPHSSASSSISSRSYQSQSYQDSRPHSRGSTTSTRSAASSVRMGAIYPAGQAGPGPGFRQQGMMGQGLNGLTSIGYNGNNEPKRQRGHSPSSTTTTSSRSSRHTSSIHLSQPVQGQHQLPQRPDWAAKNIPYHPSPIPNPSPNSFGPGGISGAMGGPGPSTTEFPPLPPHRHGTNAEPMQVERAKIRSVAGTVWNGHVPHPHPHAQQGYNGVATATASTGAGVGPGVGNIPPPPHATITASTSTSPKLTLAPGPGPSRTPHPPLTPSAQQQPAHSQVQQAQHQNEIDPDFPRRLPSKTVSTLYDPTAPKNSNSAPVSGSSASAVGSRPSSVTSHRPVTSSTANTGSTSSGNPGNAANAASTGSGSALSPEEIIEAKLAAVSINAGVSIGPPPSRGGPSYAKIVRRD